MSLFRKAEVTTAFLKMALMGLQGSGKTYTATSTAMGLVHLLREKGVAYADRPIYFLDTEKGSDWVKPRIEAAGIELFTAKTRAFSDLVSAVDEAEQHGSMLLIDSLTHFWQELCDSYMRSKKDRDGNPRTRLQFEDWAFLKLRWRTFTDAFINSSTHMVVCGRAGFEYEYVVDDDTNKKNLEKTGMKMKAEGEFGYEPDLLVLMERRMAMDTKKDHHFAKVVKDRSTLLDGAEFADPGFDNFLPHIKCLNLGGRQLGVDTSRTSEHTIPKDIRDNRRTQRKIVLAEIEDVLVMHFPSTSTKDKQAKVALLRKHFDASWTEMEEVMSLEMLRAGYDGLHSELEDRPSRYAIVTAIVPKVCEVDSLPASCSTADPLAIPGIFDRRPKANGGAHLDDQANAYLAMIGG